MPCPLRAPATRSCLSSDCAPCSQPRLGRATSRPPRTTRSPGSPSLTRPTTWSGTPASAARARPPASPRREARSPLRRSPRAHRPRARRRRDTRHAGRRGHRVEVDLHRAPEASASRRASSARPSENPSSRGRPRASARPAPGTARGAVGARRARALRRGGAPGRGRGGRRPAAAPPSGPVTGAGRRSARRAAHRRPPARMRPMTVTDRTTAGASATSPPAMVIPVRPASAPCRRRGRRRPRRPGPGHASPTTRRRAPAHRGDVGEAHRERLVPELPPAVASPGGGSGRPRRACRGSPGAGRPR